jgi:hypothetical protein
MRRFLPFLASMMATAMAADLPVRQIVLYKSGVGYFERAGDLKAGESALLDFKASDMNDVLKSLTVEDKSGAKVPGSATIQANRWLTNWRISPSTWMDSSR